MKPRVTAQGARFAESTVFRNSAANENLDDLTDVGCPFQTQYWIVLGSKVLLRNWRRGHVLA